MGINISKNVSGKYNQKLLGSAKRIGQLKIQRIHLKLLQKEQFRKQQKQLMG